MPLYLANPTRYILPVLRGTASVFPPRHQHGSSGSRRASFNAFRSKYIKLGQPHYTGAESLIKAPPAYDAYMCGSDQVWNPFMCRRQGEEGPDPVYFLTFAPKHKRVAYAPSIAVPAIPEEHRNVMAAMIGSIPHLSCREKQGAELITQLTGRHVTVDS